jgi:hypothetical protein
MAEQDLLVAEAHRVAGSLSPKLEWTLANPKWAATLNPIIANPANNGRILKNISVVSGTNVINHTLGQTLQGYFVIMNNANVTFYDKQSTNQTPQLTLNLVASGTAIISLYVF